MVTTLGEILQRPLRGCFTTVHVEGQIFGEVEPTFFQEFKAEIGNVWRLFDKDGLHHQLYVHDEHGYPLITNGWMALREHYQFNGHHEIFFKYLGRNFFQIIPNMVRITPATFPTWHSHSRRLRKAVSFKMILTEDPEVNPHLILPKEMGEYLAQTSLNELLLVEIGVEPQTCRLNYQFDPLVVTMIKGWVQCVRAHGFKVGDHLTFSMHSIYENNMIHVRKI